MLDIHFVSIMIIKDSGHNVGYNKSCGFIILPNISENIVLIGLRQIVTGLDFTGDSMYILFSGHSMMSGRPMLINHLLKSHPITKHTLIDRDIWNLFVSKIISIHTIFDIRKFWIAINAWLYYIMETQLCWTKLKISPMNINHNVSFKLF